MPSKFVAQLAAHGARDPEALAAWIGRKKHGGAAFGKLAAAGRRKKHEERSSAPARPAAVEKPSKRAAARPKAPSAVEETRAALQHALANGWVRVPDRFGGAKVRRSETRETPANLPKNWWPGKTHNVHEFVTFQADRNGKLIAFHTPPAVPWVEARQRKISAKKAREILRGS